MGMPPIVCSAVGGISFSRRTMRGRDRNGQLHALHRAHSRWHGGSLVVRLMPHIGPTTKTSQEPNFCPQTQHIFSFTARVHFSPLITRNSGFPSTHSTNHGTG